MKSLVMFFVLMMAFAGIVNAQTDCPVSQISHIKVRGEAINYMQKGFKWRRLGKLTEVGTKERYSAMLAAQMSGKKVQVSYKSNSYDCNIENTTDSAIEVTTYN